MKLQKKLLNRFDVLRVLAAVLIGFALALILLLFVSEDPVNAIRTFITGPFASKRRFFNIIELMIPLVFTSLGMCMMLQVGEYNLAVEGAFMFAGAVVAWLASMILPEHAPPVISPLLLIAVGAAAGAVCGIIPALLNIKWGSNVVVVTIMFNYILTYASTYILRYWMRDASVTYLGSQKFVKGAKLHSIISGTSMHTGVIIAALAVIATWWFVNRTTRGFEIRVTGSNRKFAKYAGINAVGAMVLAQAVGGGLAGIGGAVEILGKYDRFLWVDQTGYGFTGLMIAVLVKNRPELTPLIAFLFAYLQIGANLVGTTTDVPSEFVKVIQSIIILLIAAKLFMDSLRKRMVVRVSTEETEGK